MAVAQGLFLAAVLLFVSLRLHCSSPVPGCPEPCSCQRAPLLNCSSSGLSLVPQHILASVTELDLSHNLLDSVTLDQPHHNLRNVWLGNNSITHLSLCIEKTLGGRYGRSINPYRLRPWSRQRCVSWAPSLQLLSVERNQLEQLPEGLEGSESLQVLQLSFNRISTLQPGDLSRLRQLMELHLQHNLITSLHPQMFQDLAQLQVLDLRFNKLTSLHPLMYLSLHNIGADVRLDGNRWQCDCSMRSLRRRMAYDSSRSLQAWSVVCASPSNLSGRELLQLEEDDLNCFSAENSSELHQDVTVYRGSEILLSCSIQDSMWWTPSGQASASQNQAGLLINDITERDTGLYVCMSEEHDIVSVFNLQISKIGGTRRKIRSLTRTSQQIIPQGPPKSIAQERNQRAAPSNLVLAVCLSVFITFLIAFILGVLARPCIDILWRRVTSKKSSSETSVSSAEQRQYDNEAYCTGEEPETTHTERTRRVTFNTVDFRENCNVQYYDTVANDDEESNNQYAVTECEAVVVVKDTHTAGDSGSENSFQQSRLEETQKDSRDLSGATDAGHKHNIEYEYIPDPVELDKRSLSSRSDSSLSDKACNEDQMTWRGHITTKSPQVAEDSLQQRADFSTASKVVQISAEGSEIPGFSSEPFADWSPHTLNPSRMDPDLWQENEEQFELSDSVQSLSPRSHSGCGFFNDSKLTTAPTSYKKKSNDMSSSSSYVSEEEPTEYTVNSDKEEEEEGRERNHNKEEDYTVTRQLSDKGDMASSRIVTGEWETKKKVEPMPRTKWRVPSLGVTSHSETLDSEAPLTPAAHSSSSSSESEAEITDLKVELNTGRVNKGIKIRESVTLSTDLQHQYISQMDIDAPLPATDSTSSDESMDETRRPIKRQQRGDIDMAGIPVSQSVSHEVLNPQWPPNLDHTTPIKRYNDSSSSSESADETIDQNQKQGEKCTTRFKFQESQTSSQVPEKQWPALDLEHTMQIRRRLDIKAPSPHPDSSSSNDSDNETPNHVSKQEQGQMHMAMLPNEPYQTPSNDPEREWPVLNLEHTAHIKKQLDTKGSSPDSDSSSSSGSEDKTRNQIKKQDQREAYRPRLPIKVSQTVSDDPPTQWPALDLKHTKRIKRRLDIKTSSPPPDSSSSSESDNETPNNASKQDQWQMHMARLPNKISQTVSHDSQTQRPALGLEHTAHINRHLDVKAPSPDSDSSSSSDSEDETTGHSPGKGDIAGLPFQESKTGRHDSGKIWPTVNLEDTPRIKRRLDIKAPSPDSDSSSSSDSDDGTTNNIKKQEQKEAYMPIFSTKVSQTVSDDPPTQWPALDLEHTKRIKRRLDIKASSPPPDSSSSSESDNETPNNASKQDQWQMHMARLPNKISQTVSHDSQTQRPALGLEHTAHINRHLDVKAPSPDSDSSSSSDSEDETTGHSPGKGDIAGLPFQESKTGMHDSGKIWPTVNLEDTPRIKRRLDIKAPSPDSDSSSSSDSDDGTTNNIKKQEQKEAYMPIFSTKVSQTVSDDPPTQWPALDLEHTKRIKRRLDIKASSPPPDSSSSSESDNETPNNASKQDQWQMHMARLPNKISQTISHDSQTQRPALDLEHTAHINRHLDVKAPSPDSDSSSSSDSDDETTSHRPSKMNIAGLPFQGSQTGKHDLDKMSQRASYNPETQCSEVELSNISHVKRRLEIKAPLPPPDSLLSSGSSNHTGKKKEAIKVSSSSSSSDEQEEVKEELSNPPTTVEPDPDSRWPQLGLSNAPHVKRRLDIRARSPPLESSSSSNENEVGTTDQPSKIQRDRTDVGKWSLHVPYVNRRLNVKAPMPQPDLIHSVSTSFQQSESNSSASESENENRDHDKLQLGVSALSKETEKKFIRSAKISVIHTSHKPKTDHGIILEKYTVISDDVEGKATSDNINTTPKINPELESRWAMMNLGISRFRKRVEITPRTNEPPNLPSSPPPDSLSSSSSDEGTGSKDGRTRQKRKRDGMQGIIHTGSSLTPEVKQEPVNISLSLKTEDNNSGITEEVKDRLRKDYSLYKTKEKSNADIMVTDFGAPYSKRYLDVKDSKKAPATPPLRQLSASSSSSSSESEDASTEHVGKGWRGRSQLPAITDEEASQIQASPYAGQAVETKVDRSQSQTEEVERTIARVEHKTTSSESSEDETIERSVPDLSLGVPRVKRRLNITALSPGSNNSQSSCSKNENEVTEYTAKQSRDVSDITDDDAVITYKRLIFKPSSRLNNSFSSYTSAETVTVSQEGPSHSVQGRNASLAPITVPSMSFDDVVKKRMEQSRHSTDMDLPSKIRWTGIGHQMSSLSMSSMKRSLEVQQASPVKPQLLPHDSFNNSSVRNDDLIKQDRGKESNLSANSVSLASGTTLDKSNNPASETDEILWSVPEDRRERKGLSALKTLSSDRRKWDTQAENLDKGAGSPI